MKKMLLPVLALLALSAGAQVKFVKTTDLKPLFEQAKKEKKLIFIDAYTDWCGWCKVLDKEVFSTRAIGDTMSKYFIATKFEMEKDSIGVLLTRKYGTGSYPTALVLNGNGDLVYEIEGYSPAPEYAKKLADAADPAKQTRERGYSNSFQVSYPSFYLDAIPMKKENRKFADSMTVNAYLEGQKDLSQEQNWAVMKKFYFRVGPETFKRVLLQRESLTKKFGRTEYEKLAGNLIGVRISECTKSKDLKCVEQYLDLMEQLVKDSKKNRTYYIENYYSKNEMWEELARQVNAQLGNQEYAANHSHINDVAWGIYEKSDHRPTLEQAASWMVNVVREEPVYMYLDTYAALLYKTKKLPEARKYAQEAIAAGKKSGEDVSETEELLKKIDSETKK